MNRLLLIKNYFDDFITALLQHRRVILKHLLVLLPVMACYGTISFAGKLLGAEFLFKLAQTLVFAGAGALHFYLLHKALELHRLRFKGGAVMYTLCLSVLICIVLLGFYLFTENSLAMIALVSAAAFSLPHMCIQAWEYYRKVPPKQYPLWTAPAKERDINELLIPKAVTFRFLLPAKNNDNQEEVFFKTVPEEWKLGKAFYSVLRTSNNGNGTTIEYSDESGAPCGWEFYSFFLNGLIKRRLEPEESLSENRITSNATIHVRRVYIKNTLPSSN